MLLYVTSGKAEGDCKPPGIPVERSLVVWQLLWRRLQYWDRSGFSVRGECMWLRVGYILCRVIRYIKGTDACVGDCKYLPVWRKQVQPQRIKESSIMSPPRLNHLPKSSDSPGDLHSCKCQSHRMRNRISCCSFIINEASICAYEKWTAKVSLVILASLFIQILIGCSDWLSHFPWFSVGVIDDTPSGPN